MSKTIDQLRADCAKAQNAYESAELTEAKAEDALLAAREARLQAFNARSDAKYALRRAVDDRIIRAASDPR